MSHRSVADVVAAHLAEWDTPFVELAIFGNADPARISAALDVLCAESLGSPAAGALFYQSSVAAVAGLELRDGRRVVVKAHQPDQSISTLAELARMQARVAEANRLAPRPLAGPLPFANGFATIEEHDERGAPADAHDPDVRHAIAAALHEVVELLAPLGAAGMRAAMTAAESREHLPSFARHARCRAAETLTRATRDAPGLRR